MYLKKISIFVLCLTLAPFGGCLNRTQDGIPRPYDEGPVKIAVFIPGVASDNAAYEMLAIGVRKAALEHDAQVTVIEGGYDPVEWEGWITDLADSAVYDLIVSSNPLLPAIAQSVTRKFPEQHFLLLDGYLNGNPTIYTMQYNQREQAYIAGYLAALITAEAAPLKNTIGLILAREYSIMQKIILPSYLEGARAVNPKMKVDFKTIDSWVDTAKAEDIASIMFSQGVKVILPIAGDANSGVLKAAENSHGQLIWFDSNGYAIRPGVIAGCCAIMQEKAAYEKTILFLRGNLQFGKAEIVGIEDGYIDFIDTDPLFLDAVSANVGKKLDEMLVKLRSGKLPLPLATL